MSSEEELDGLEKSIQETMYRYMFLRFLRLLGVALVLLSVELAVVVLAVIGLAHLRGWMAAAGGAVFLAVLGVRAWRWRVNVRRRPAKPSRRFGVAVKLASLPLNVLVFPAFAAWMPPPIAVTACFLLLAVEIGLWLIMRGPAADELNGARDFMQNATDPRTWEV